MCSPAIIPYALMAVSAVASAKAASDQAATGRAVANNNAAIAETQAQDAQRRGDLEAQEARRHAQQVMGAQRAQMSARGLDISGGTAADLIEQADFFGQVDAATARANAQKEAWNLRAQKQNYQIEARANNPKSAMWNSLLSSAGSVAGKWYGSGG